MAGRRELRFAQRMSIAGRLKTWIKVQGFAAGNTGTFIAETLSMKCPSRLWWTTDKISENSPFPYASSGNRHRICYEMEFRPFGNWCFHHYTSPVTGKAFLLDLPIDEKKAIWNRVVASGCVSTYLRKARKP